MRKRTGILSIAALLFVAAGIPSAHADRLSRKPGISPGGKTFSISSNFSGGLTGTIRVGDHKVVITKKTVLYSTTDGMLARGTHVVRNPVYVTGTVSRDGQFVATMIVVNQKSGSGGRIGLLPANKAR